MQGAKSIASPMWEVLLWRFLYFIVKWIAGSVAVLLLLLILGGMWLMSDPVDMEKLSLVRAGMTRSEVEAILGPPSHWEVDARVLRYSKWMVEKFVIVVLDDKGRVLRTAVRD